MSDSSAGGPGDSVEGSGPNPIYDACVERRGLWADAFAKYDSHEPGVEDEAVTAAVEELIIKLDDHAKIFKVVHHSGYLAGRRQAS